MSPAVLYDRKSGPIAGFWGPLTICLTDPHALLIGLPEDEVRGRVLMAQAQIRQGRPEFARRRQTEIVVVKRRGPRTN
jgi:hypothetical protein